MKPTIEFEIINEDGCDETYKVPGKYILCPRCRGTGRQCNPNIDGHGITAEEWNGPDWSDEDKEFYLSGGYDIDCTTCSGRTTILEVDEEACDKATLDKYFEYLKQKTEDKEEYRSELEYGY
jgi:hypothetical protein